jgi:transcription antitermination factor NusG
VIKIKDQLIINKEVKIINGAFKGLKGILVGAHSESYIVVVMVNEMEFQMFKTDIVQE